MKDGRQDCRLGLADCYGVIDDEVNALPPLLLGSVFEPDGAVMSGVVPVSELVPAEAVLVVGVLPAVVPVVVAPVTEAAPGDVPVIVLADVVPLLLFAAVPPAPVVPVATSGTVPELSLLPPQPNRPAVAARHASQPRRSEWVIAFSKLMLLGAPQCIDVEGNAHQVLSDIKPAWGDAHDAGHRLPRLHAEATVCYCLRAMKPPIAVWPVAALDSVKVPAISTGPLPPAPPLITGPKKRPPNPPLSVPLSTAPVR